MAELDTIAAERAGLDRREVEVRSAGEERLKRLALAREKAALAFGGASAKKQTGARRR